MSTPIYRYPEDGTGASPDNLVAAEEHQLSNRAIRCVAPTYGGFFAKGVIVKDLATGIALIRGVDYTFGELFEFPSGRYKAEIFGLIVISKPNVAKVAITYQALGGNYSYSMDAVIAMLDNLDLGERPVAWGSITNRPALFDPASHLHDLGDIYGFEYVVHSIERLRDAILVGDVVSHDEIYRYIDRASIEQANAIAAVQTHLDAHVADKNNPHNTTKAQVGLDQVQNFPIATQAQVDAGSTNVAYVTPATIYKNVTDRAVTPLANHIGDKSNPHGTTKAQVGLDQVQNYPVATDAQSLEATNNTTYVTPRGVAQMMKRDAIDPINAHVTDMGNPHGTTKTQVGLGNVDNYPTANQAQMDAGTSTNLFVTPAIVAKYVQNAAGAALQAHISNTSNPHSTTKAQVGLGNVDNFATATDAIAQAGVSTSNFVTPANMWYAVRDWAVNPIQAHLADRNNPHGTTQAQVGLGNVQNYSMADGPTTAAGQTGQMYTSPYGVVYAINTLAVNPMNAHKADMGNPHNTTKAQIGLGQVENYLMATGAEAQAAQVDWAYMTPYKTRLSIDAIVPQYFNIYRASIDQARQGQRDDLYVTPAGMNARIADNNASFYTRADVDYLIATRTSSFVFTSGSDQIVNRFTSGSRLLDYGNNFFDIYPPNGKTMSNLAAFTSSMAFIDFAGSVQDDDNLCCKWQNLGDRVRVWVFSSEQSTGARANWLGVWS